MPFELRGNCVWKTEPEEMVQCFDTNEEAVSHLATLQESKPDTQESASVRRYQEAALAPTADTPMTGKSWDVTVMGPSSPDDIVTVDGTKYLKSKNKRLYSLDGLEAAVNSGVFNDIQVFDNHLTDDEFKSKQGMRSADSELLGAIVSPYWDAKTSSIKGTQKIIKEDLSKKILNAHEAGILGIFGLSVDTTPIMAQDIQIDNEFFPVVSGIEKVTSIDLVSKPAAGGKFNRVLAAENNNQEREGNSREVETMNEEEMKALIGKTVIDALNAKEEDTRIKLEEKATEEAEAERLRLEEEKAKEEGNDNQPEMVPVAQVEELDAKFQALESRTLLRESLAESGLSANGQAIVTQAFSNRIFEAKDLEAMIKVTKDAEIANDGTGRVVESGGARETVVTGGFDQAQRMEVEFMRKISTAHDFDNLEHSTDLTVRSRLKESAAHKDWINAGKPKTGGYRRTSDLIYALLGNNDPFLDNIRFTEASTLATVTKNTVNIFIAADYAQQDRWYESIVQVREVDTIDDVTMARLYGLAELDVVLKGDPYTELAQSDEEETSVFVKKGNFVAVPIEDMMTDKIDYFRTLPRRLSDSWFNTLSALTAGVFTVASDVGPTLSDTGALFNNTAATSAGGHANLLTTALTAAGGAFGAARTAMRKQTNRPLGVGRKLLSNSPRFLLVPEDLETIGITLRNSDKLPGTANNDINRFKETFDVVVVPDWTDTNNWALIADPMRNPAIYHIFPRGGNVPQLFTADSEVAGAMFTNDTIRWKIRMMTYRKSATEDCAPVSDFRPLHKNNVA